MNSFIISNFAKWLVGGELFKSAKDVVEVLNNSELSSSEKKEQAFKELKELAGDLGSFMLNIAIELAVVWAKSKS